MNACILSFTRAAWFLVWVRSIWFSFHIWILVRFHWWPSIALLRILLFYIFSSGHNCFTLRIHLIWISVIRNIWHLPMIDGNYILWIGQIQPFSRIVWIPIAWLFETSFFFSEFFWSTVFRLETTDFFGEFFRINLTLMWLASGFFQAFIGATRFLLETTDFFSDFSGLDVHGWFPSSPEVMESPAPSYDSSEFLRRFNRL